MSPRGPNLGPSVRVVANVADPKALPAFGPSASSAQVRPHVVEPEVLLSERESCWSEAGDGGDELGPLAVHVPLPVKRLGTPGSSAGLRSPLSRTSTSCSSASRVSTFSLGFGESSPSQRLRGARRGAVIVNVVGRDTPALKIPAADIAALEENGVLEWEKVEELFSMLTGEQVTSLYYRVRCSVNGSTETERDAAATTMRLILFEDGPNPFLGGMAVDAYLDGKEPLEAVQSGGRGSGARCTVQ